MFLHCCDRNMFSNTSLRRLRKVKNVLGNFGMSLDQNQQYKNSRALSFIVKSGIEPVTTSKTNVSGHLYSFEEFQWHKIVFSNIHCQWNHDLWLGTIIFPFLEHYMPRMRKITICIVYMEYNELFSPRIRQELAISCWKLLPLINGNSRK